MTEPLNPDTPEFQGTHLFQRLLWAKENLEPYQSDYRVLFEDSARPDDPASVLVPDPNWMACALNGGILPPVWVYHELADDEAQPDFKRHTRGHLLHETKPVSPMTEEEAIEYLIQQAIPRHVWMANEPKMKICRTSNLPKTREWRNAWRVAA